LNFKLTRTGEIGLFPLSISPCALLFSVGLCIYTQLGKGGKNMEKLENRTIDDLGRVILPREFRQAHGWGEKTVVTIYQDNDTLVIKLAASQEEPGGVA